MWIIYNHFYFCFLPVNGNKIYVKVSLENCAYKIMDKQMTDYFDENLFEMDED